MRISGQRGRQWCRGRAPARGGRTARAFRRARASSAFLRAAAALARDAQIREVLISRLLVLDKTNRDSRLFFESCRRCSVPLAISCCSLAHGCSPLAARCCWPLAAGLLAAGPLLAPLLAAVVAEHYERAEGGVRSRTLCMNGAPLGKESVSAASGRRWRSEFRAKIRSSGTPRPGSGARGRTWSRAPMHIHTRTLCMNGTPLGKESVSAASGRRWRSEFRAKIRSSGTPCPGSGHAGELGHVRLCTFTLGPYA